MKYVSLALSLTLATALAAQRWQRRFLISKGVGADRHGSGSFNRLAAKFARAVLTSVRRPRPSGKPSVPRPRFDFASIEAEGRWRGLRH
jgi:hypothetical protein